MVGFFKCCLTYLYNHKRINTIIMTTEEIEKAGREYESKIVVKDAYAHIHYEEGIKFANKH